MAVRISNRLRPVSVRIGGLAGTYVPPPPPNTLHWTTNPGILGTYDEKSSFSFDFASVIFDPSNSANDWRVIDGALPSGTYLNPFTGSVSGTLPEVNADTVVTFTLQVKDLVGTTITGVWKIKIHNIVPAVQWITPSGELSNSAAGESVYQPLEAKSV